MRDCCRRRNVSRRPRQSHLAATSVSVLRAGSDTDFLITETGVERWARQRRWSAALPDLVVATGGFAIAIIQRYCTMVGRHRPGLDAVRRLAPVVLCDDNKRRGRPAVDNRYVAAV